jgi:hypothetical protein
VLNAIVGDQRVFQGNVFDGDVYLNRRLRDETVNQDLDLGSLDDLRIYVYYNDYTEL